ncbi:hypothetical protein WICPIJ_008176, partial [Wickerhamomyces pijperi]
MALGDFGYGGARPNDPMSKKRKVTHVTKLSVQDYDYDSGSRNRPASVPGISTSNKAHIRGRLSPPPPLKPRPMIDEYPIAPPEKAKLEFLSESSGFHKVKIRSGTVPVIERLSNLKHFKIDLVDDSDPEEFEDIDPASILSRTKPHTPAAPTIKKKSYQFSAPKAAPSIFDQTPSKKDTRSQKRFFDSDSDDKGAFSDDAYNDLPLQTQPQVSSLDLMDFKGEIPMSVSNFHGSLVRLQYKDKSLINSLQFKIEIQNRANATADSVQKFDATIHFEYQFESIVSLKNTHISKVIYDGSRVLLRTKVVTKEIDDNRLLLQFSKEQEAGKFIGLLMLGCNRFVDFRTDPQMIDDTLRSFASNNSFASKLTGKSMGSISRQRRPKSTAQTLVITDPAATPSKSSYSPLASTLLSRPKTRAHTRELYGSSRSDSTGVTESVDLTDYSLIEVRRSPRTSTPAKRTIFTPTLRHPFKDGTVFHVDNSDFQLLYEHEWLNDTLIDFFFRYYSEESARIFPENEPNDLGTLKQKGLSENDFKVMSSFFYTQMMKKDKKKEKDAGQNATADGKDDTAKTKQPMNYYGNISRWLAKVDLSKLKYLIIPINEGLHWYGVIITGLKSIIDFNAATNTYTLNADTSQRITIHYFDSMKNDHKKIKQPLMQVIQGYAMEKLNLEIPKELFVIKECWVPRQPNSNDCGIHLIHAIKVFFEKPLELMYCWSLAEGQQRNKGKFLIKMAETTRLRSNLRSKLVYLKNLMTSKQEGLDPSQVVEGKVEDESDEDDLIELIDHEDTVTPSAPATPAVSATTENEDVSKVNATVEESTSQAVVPSSTTTTTLAYEENTVTENQQTKEGADQTPILKSDDEEILESPVPQPTEQDQGQLQQLTASPEEVLSKPTTTTSLIDQINEELADHEEDEEQEEHIELHPSISKDLQSSRTAHQMASLPPLVEEKDEDASHGMEPIENYWSEQSVTAVVDEELGNGSDEVGSVTNPVSQLTISDEELEQGEPEKVSESKAEEEEEEEEDDDVEEQVEEQLEEADIEMVDSDVVEDSPEREGGYVVQVPGTPSQPSDQDQAQAQKLESSKEPQSDRDSSDIEQWQEVHSSQPQSHSHEDAQLATPPPPVLSNSNENYSVKSVSSTPPPPRLTNSSIILDDESKEAKSDSSPDHRELRDQTDDKNENSHEEHSLLTDFSELSGVDTVLNRAEKLGRINVRNGKIIQEIDEDEEEEEDIHRVQALQFFDSNPTQLHAGHTDPQPRQETTT